MAAAKTVKNNVALVNGWAGSFSRVKLAEVAAIENQRTRTFFVMQSGYRIEAVNDPASVAAEEAWCKLMGIE